jgi:hypothetical protein
LLKGDGIAGGGMKVCFCCAACFCCCRWPRTTIVCNAAVAISISVCLTACSSFTSFTMIWMTSADVWQSGDV